MNQDKRIYLNMHRQKHLQVKVLELLLKMMYHSEEGQDENFIYQGKSEQAREYGGNGREFHWKIGKIYLTQGREMKRIGFYCSMCILILSISGCSWKQSKELTEHSEAFFAMDTYMTFTAYGADAEPALLAAEDKIKELEDLWSVTNQNSDVYAVNHSDGKAVTVNKNTAELCSFAMTMAEKTNGALEPTIYPVLTAWGFTTGENRIPSETELAALLEKVGHEKVKLEDGQIRIEAGSMIDFGAVGKGYAGDEAAQILRERGITSALLDIGGNIQAIGTKPDGSNWRIGLKDPFSGGVLGILQVSDEAVVTSGNYERFFTGEDGKVYGHIIDPLTGYPVENGFASVSVIAGEGKLCDALSTSLFVMGLERAQDYWRQHREFEMILVMQDGNIYLTEGVRDRFSLHREYKNMKINVID